MRDHRIAGGGGVGLHVLETGNLGGRAILFIHGFSQCSLVWTRQLHSDLGDDYRLVAMDMRGHGLSDKPSDGYGDTKLWAGDVHAVIEKIGLEQPVLCGWSYGSLITLDYIRHYGEDQIGGLHFVDAISKLGSEEAMSVITPEFAELIPGFFSTDVGESVSSLESLIRLCFVREPTAEEVYLMLGIGVSVPPHVREGLFSRLVDNDDLLAKLRKPLLITHGEADGIVRPSVVDQHSALVGNAQVQMVANAGHAPFWEDAPTFNERLRTFVENL